MRALCGVGARADTMCELLAREAGWTTAADLQDEGYSKRNIARILADLEHAGLATGLHVKGPALRFRLARNEPLRALVAGTDVAFPRWRQILGFVSAAVEFASVDGPSATTRRVAAHNLAESMRPIAEQLWIDAPPTTRGDPNASEAVKGWLGKELLSLANGTSPAFGVEAVKAAELPGGGEAWIWLSARAPGHDRVAAVLRTPKVPGAQLAAEVPGEDGWTAYRLIFNPRLPPVAVRNTVEHLVFPLKVAWRSAGTSS